jgi:hypothetical protein
LGATAGTIVDLAGERPCQFASRRFVAHRGEQLAASGGPAVAEHPVYALMTVGAGGLRPYPHLGVLQFPPREGAFFVARQND